MEEDNVNWRETYFEVVASIVFDLNDLKSKVAQLYENEGRGSLYELADEITKEFEELYKDTLWDGEWIDVLDDFISKKIDELD